MAACACRWAAFEAQPPPEISHADVPWPPSAAALLRWLAAAARQESFVQQGVLHSCGQQGPGSVGGTSATAGADATARDLSRTAFRQASRRWHPDKFEARFGPRIAAEDLTAVMAGVQALMQGINEAAAAQQAVN